MLPYKTEVLKFPLGTKIEAVKSNIGEVQKMQLDQKIQPAPKPIHYQMKTTEAEIQEGPEYQKNGFYPSEHVSYNIGIGIENGENVVFLTVHTYPALYQPSTNEIFCVDEVQLEILYELPTQPTSTNDAYDLVIITPSDFVDGLQPLVAHKEDMGIVTKLATLDEIYGGTYFTTNGRDDAERIKYFIKNAREEWGIQYVLLVGGRNGGVNTPAWWCPVRYTYLNAGDGDRKFLSDLYFADFYKYEDGEAVFEDWDSTGNDIFGEWSFRGKDMLDMYPDVYIGRLACRNAFEVDVMVEKIITYETSTYGQSWASRYVGIGGDTFTGDQWYDGEESVMKTIEYLSEVGVTGTTLFTSDGTLSQGQDIIDAVSAGCGFLNFEGHGNPMSWANHPPQDGETWIGIDESQFIFFKNENMYPICVVGGCSNSKFDISLLNLLDFQNISNTIAHASWGPECFSWWMARKVDGGAIATIGCTSYGYGKSGDTDDDGIFDGIQYRGGFIDIEFFRMYAQEGKDMLGEAHAGALVSYLNKFPPMTDLIDGKTVEEWALLGDPSLKIGGYP
jgi:hypothetical protein